MLCGNIKYKAGRLLYNASEDSEDEKVEFVSKKYIHDHDSILDLILNWNGGLMHDSRHIIIKSNYPWVYKSKQEIREDVEYHKLLTIPSLKKFGRKSLSGFRNILIHDKFAKIFTILEMLHICLNWSSKLIRSNLVNENDENYLVVIVNGRNITERKRIMYISIKSLNEKEKTDILRIRKLLNNASIIKLLNLIYLNKWKVINQLDAQLCDQFNIDNKLIQSKINESVQFIRDICQITMHNDRILLTHLQGRDSDIRSVIPKRVPSMRAQILLCPACQPSQILVPMSWAKHFLIMERHLEIYDPSIRYSVIPEKYIYKMKGVRMVIKRDPTISWASFSVHDEVCYIHIS
ncbi:LEF-9-like protein [Glossina pallidipes salivary gland hypertrophy virus]|uniref:LEF-9-like protein n=1 Tax=Glossina hytrovirus (isolate Glossina pallidipes/Ethiopia/Seibersdorf/-) TaxID=379529 RepID=A0A0Y0LSZ4_GHVS|nr:LEF-9-like protein [Glossina pallidipes salivary gland hypertrophy virus]